MENVSVFSFSFNWKTLTPALSVVFFFTPREIKYPLHITFLLFRIHTSEYAGQACCPEEFLRRSLVRIVVAPNALYRRSGKRTKKLCVIHATLARGIEPSPFNVQLRELKSEKWTDLPHVVIFASSRTWIRKSLFHFLSTLFFTTFRSARAASLSLE